MSDPSTACWRTCRLRERVEDLEDERELDAAIRHNGDKPLIPWEQAKNELGLV